MKILQGDSLEVLKTLESESVDCIVTSPPYWALRDYGVDGQLGLESTFQEYISKLCDIFDECKRVLKKEGTCWVNIGDTYSGNKEGKTDNKVSDYLKDTTINLHKKRGSIVEKSLIQIPSRFAIEMVDRGWTLRNEIIWHKPNCMPSSVTDRFTVDFEKVFFFVKSKKYFFESIKEPVKENLSIRTSPSKKYAHEGTGLKPHTGLDKNYEVKNKRTVWSINTKGYSEAHFATYPEKLIEPMIQAGCPVGGLVLDPFSGAGTTGVVALKQSKDYLGIEINPEYIELSEKRLSGVTAPLFV